ncbi:MAG: ATP-dependent DNA helicase [Candidatus Kaelpia aquatica]|nr:ATP-dependent DNA helicase [Candidatus Kaelpia aquatica]
MNIETIETKIAEGLNAQQKKAVQHGDGPLLIVAGAGTGKTLVLTRRIIDLISSKKAYPKDILALTFTEKATEEMEERVDILMPYGYTDMTISTFHAFGDRVLKENALELGLSPDLYVLSRAEQIIFFREHLFEFPLNYFRPLGDPTKYVESILALISRAKDEDLSPEEYLNYVDNLKRELKNNPDDKILSERIKKDEEVALSYQRYQEILQRESKIDFGDQVYLSLKLLREHPAILKEYQDRFKYILVDEFQDTNHSQFELLKLLVGDRGNITVCGDDDQSVYKFRGAALSNIMEFMDIYPNAEKIILKDNYRSNQKILDFAYRSISYNNPDRLEVKENLDKRLKAHLKEGDGVKYYNFDTLFDESDWVSGRIDKMVKEEGYSYKDFAILVRSNRDADPFIRSLNMRSIPLRFSGSEGLYSQEEIRFFISWLKFLTNPEDSLSLYYILSSKLYSFKIEVLSLMMSRAKLLSRSLYYLITHYKEDGIAEVFIDNETSREIGSFLEILNDFFRLSLNLNTGQLLFGILNQSGYLKILTAGGLEAESEIKNIARFFEIVRSTSRVLTNDDIYNFAPYLNALIEAGDDPSLPGPDYDTDSVNVLTIHKAKGLEFRVVFLVSLVSDRFPVRKRKEAIALADDLLRMKEHWLPEGDPHIQEERRLFYVGTTRARESLFLSSAHDYGTKRAKKVSVFVMEALDLPKQPGVSLKSSAWEVIQRSRAREFGKIEEPKSLRSDELLNLSHLQVDDYFTCPLKYKYIHILRVPVIQHHSVIYGKAIHDAIQIYLREKIKDRSVSLDLMLDVFKSSWISEGFLTREHEDMRFEEGQELLKRFYENEELSKSKPAYVEKEFVFLIDYNRISGRFDRVDIVDNEVSIVDYKTSKVDDYSKAQKKAKESLQLGIYALAYKKIFGCIPSSLELHFIDSGIVGRVSFREQDLKDVEEKISIASGGIRNRDFNPKPSYFACAYCVFKNICPFTLKGA